jgi:hypothetical protein
MYAHGASEALSRVLLSETSWVYLCHYISILSELGYGTIQTPKNN